MNRSMKLSAFSGLFALGLAAPLLATGCNTEAVCFADCSGQALVPGGGSDSGGEGGDGLVIGFGGEGNGSSGGTSGRGGSAPLEDAGMTCDGIDFQTDVNHCGECGNHCVITGANSVCLLGKCEIDECLPGRFDLDGDPNNGCEYACDLRNAAGEICTEGDAGCGDEACDEWDNDCDGDKNEGFDLTNDPNNCGFCGNACNLFQAISACEIVGSTPDCVVTGCAAGYFDNDELDFNGCEYQCEYKDAAGEPCSTPDGTTCGVEVCDAVDSDCDGELNNGNPGAGQPCSDYCPDDVCLGPCQAGTTFCIGGPDPLTAIGCIGSETGPTGEICDNVDNDCDGVIDDGFNLATDANNCGECGTSCVGALPNAVAQCTDPAGPAGPACSVLVCDAGYKDLVPGQPGCEQCPKFPFSPETCNGIDDNCDGTIDNAASISGQRPNAAAFCNNGRSLAGTPCAGTTVICDPTPGAANKGWICNFPNNPAIEVVTATGKVRVVEQLCDDADGNCDGQIDEAFLTLGDACDDGALGVCLDQGEVRCDPADITHTQTFCDTTLPPDSPDASAETCNGKDDNCDGQTDEGTDDMVRINRGGLNYWIDKYEASRPDATNSTVGSDETHLCGTGNRLPWTNASFQEARDACLASNKRLCTINELQQACDGVEQNRTYPYTGAYVGATCNGIDAPGSAPMPTGSRAGCVSFDGIFDLSGNVSEWSSTKVGETTTVPKLDIMALHGGSYLTPSNGLTCSFDLDVLSTNAVLPSLGFRCCRNP